MSNAIYPTGVRGVTFSVVVADEYDTLIQPSPNKYETRIGQYAQPIHRFTLIYDYLKNNAADIAPGLTFTDLVTLRGFFNSRSGQYDDFLFYDWTDPTDAAVTNQALSLVASGGVSYSPIQVLRNLFYEDVTDLQPTGGNDHSLFTLKANGVTQTYGTNYTIAGPGLALPGSSYLGLYVQWVGTPTAPITASFQYFYRVRWASDSQDFERFMQLLWTIGGSQGKNGKGTLELITARPAGV